MRDCWLFGQMFRFSQLLFPKLWAIFLLSEEGTDPTVAKVRFEVLPISPGSHLETRGVARVGGKSAPPPLLFVSQQ